MPEHLQRLFIKLPNPSSDEVLAGFPETQNGYRQNPSTVDISDAAIGYSGSAVRGERGHNDEGSAARFFYSPKASKYDREAGLDDFDTQEFAQSNGGKAAIARGDDAVPNNDSSVGLNKIKRARNHHPTVKPTNLMQYLCRLVTPPGGLILDPFLGSGSTAKAALIERFRIVGIEMDHDYCEIARARCNANLQPKLI